MHLQLNKKQSKQILLTTRPSSNVTYTDKTTIKKFNRIKNEVTIIKQADKSLGTGIVVLNTDDYVAQCTSHLSDTSTYRQASNYPRCGIKNNSEIPSLILSHKTVSIAKNCTNSSC